jgi:FkbM family methyltransferase
VINFAARVSSWLGEREPEWSPWPGTRFSVNLGDRIQRQMWCGCYEPHVTRCLRAILRKGDTFIDIGAHIGYHSFFAAKLVEPDGAVLAFEPDPCLYDRLMRNLKSFSHAQAFQAAVWDRDAELTFERSSFAQESGWGTLAAVRDLGRGEHIAVRTVSLDRLVNDKNLKSIRAMKVDAEGAEVAILDGAWTTFHNFRPILLFEVNGILLQQGGRTASDLLERLAGWGYRLYAIGDNGLQRCGSVPNHEITDCLGLPEEQVEKVLASF